MTTAEIVRLLTGIRGDVDEDLQNLPMSIKLDKNDNPTDVQIHVARWEGKPTAILVLGDDARARGEKK